MRSVRAQAVLMEPATRTRSAQVWGDHPRDPVLQASESAASSASPVEPRPVRTTPTPPLPRSTRPRTRTPASTLTARTTTMSASSGKEGEV